ncbi:ABC transporter ATP-binding protein [Clostridium sp. BL-8]|uniref:ABC transporter ATP-binding protein n=1 Tax=Clostridium sp. BL-8 TaxID=349938 RepID=UPI00098C705D|nr:ABC transporter ATP-binding protein [Clostridium sp. BL-8]OOM79205.1 aliphatic sulfonates import ATP-binding protein SsuB [Clostridium sp. BL-8]
MSAIKVENFVKTFDNEYKLFDNLNLEIGEREIIGIVGTSGCGKSTLLRSIAGLDTNYGGKIYINNQENKGISKKIGFIFQEARLMPWLNVEENVAFGLKEEDKIKKVSEIIKLVDLNGYSKYYPKELSGGMAQRIAIARSLVNSPEILLLDEPFSALDAFTKMNLQDLVLDMWKSNRISTVVIITHDIEEAVYLCDKLFVFRKNEEQAMTEIKIESERPRKRGDSYLVELRASILELLKLEPEFEI